MKPLLRNNLIALLYYTGLTHVYRTRARKTGPLVRVLSFHDVRDAAWFASLIATLQSEYNLLTVAEFEQKKFATQKINLLLTFDDGYQSWTQNVLPVLQQHGLQGIFFVSSGLLDAAGTEREQEFVQENLLLRTKRQLLSWEGVRTLHDTGQVIGGHTASHSRLAKLSREEVQKEVVEDKQRLEAFLQTKLTHFAYPFGTEADITRDAEEVAQSAGYTHLHTAIPGWYICAHPHRTPRLLLEEGQSLASVKRWIAGGYDLYSAFKK